MQLMVEELGPMVTIDQVVRAMGESWDNLSLAQKAEIYNRIQQVNNAWQAPFAELQVTAMITALASLLAIILIAILLELGIAAGVMAVLLLILELVYAGSSLMSIGAGGFAIMVGAIQRRYELYKQRLAAEGIDISDWPENFLHLIGEEITTGSVWLVNFFEGLPGVIINTGEDLIDTLRPLAPDYDMTHPSKI